ncbi:MAG: glycoside hydrolase family 16 protein [Promethearchaeota archaeon]
MEINRLIVIAIPIAVVLVGLILINFINMIDTNNDRFKPNSPHSWEKLVWSDEFDYSGLPDENKWNFELHGPGWVNDEEQAYVKNINNSRVENDVLIIEARKDYTGFGYTSARITTRYKGNWTYGRFEARIKLPSGRGIWPAFWMMPKEGKYGSWPNSGEMDIMEYVGFTPGITYGTIHCSAYNWVNGNQKGGNINVTDCETSFHVYAIEWFPDRIDFYVDKKNYFTYKNEDNTTFMHFSVWPFDQEFYFILNIAVGGTWGGQKGVDDSIFPQRMIVDYVRVYQNSSYQV